MFKELRESKNLTQEELGNILEVDKTTVGKWELGLAFPKSTTLIKISEFFKVPIQDFYSALKEKEEQ